MFEPLSQQGTNTRGGSNNGGIGGSPSGADRKVPHHPDVKWGGGKSSIGGNGNTGGPYQTITGCEHFRVGNYLSRSIIFNISIIRRCQQFPRCTPDTALGAGSAVDAGHAVVLKSKDLVRKGNLLVLQFIGVCA